MPNDLRLSPWLMGVLVPLVTVTGEPGIGPAGRARRGRQPDPVLAAAELEPSRALLQLGSLLGQPDERVRGRDAVAVPVPRDADDAGLTLASRLSRRPGRREPRASAARLNDASRPTAASVTR